MGSELSGWVDTILTVLFVLVGVLMTFFILLQEGKGGGLAALGGTKAAGVEGVTNPIRRATGYLAGLFFSLAIILGILHKPDDSVKFSAPSAGMSSTAPKTEATTTDAPKTEEKKIDAKPAEAPKTSDAPPADSSKAAETPKAPATPAETPKPADAPKTEEKKDGAAAPAAPATEKK